jgi:hypothetical protein
MPDVLAIFDAAGRLVVAGAFGWAAIGKLTDLPALRTTLYLSGVTRPWVSQLTAGLPTVELYLALTLVQARAGWVAAAGAALLLLAFIAYLGLDRTSGQACACFGGWTSASAPAPGSRRAGIVRDVLLLAALTPALVRGPGAGRPGVPAPPEPWALVTGVLLASGLVWWALRRDARRRRTAAPAARSGRRRSGVPLVRASAATRQAVPFDLLALDGTRLRLTELSMRPGGVTVVFTEPGCVVCEALLPLLTVRQDVVLLVAVLDPADVAAWAAEHDLPLSRVAADVDGAVADSYQVPANPAACRADATGWLVDAQGAPAPRLAVGREAIAALLPLPPAP